MCIRDRKYIAELDEESAQRVTAGFQKVLADITQSAAQAGDHADQFGTTLAQWSESQGVAEPASIAEKGIDKLLLGTRAMQGAICTLKERLDDSRSEIERLRQEVDRAREDALVDGLTGLVNRKGFDLALAACLTAAETSTHGTCALIADIDHFKRVNDTFGHLYGDEVLLLLANLMRRSFRRSDLLFRYGGEEFAVILNDTDAISAAKVIDEIRNVFSRLLHLSQDDEFSVSFSCGIADLAHFSDATSLSEAAEKALYQAKQRGRNKVVVNAGD